MRLLALLSVLFFLAAPVSAVELLPGDVVVLDPGNDAVVRVRPDAYDSGDPDANQALITSGGNIASPHDVAVGDGVLYVTDTSSEAIVRVETETGAQSLVPIPESVRPRGIALDSRGKLLVGDRNLFALLEVDPVTGAAVQITDGTWNVLLNTPMYVDLGPGDEIFILESNGLWRLDVPTKTATKVGADASKGLTVDDTTRDLYSSGSSDIYRYAPDAYDSGDPSANRTVVFDESDANDVGLLPGGDLVATDAVVAGSGNVDLARIELDSGVSTIAANRGELLLTSGLAVVAPEPEASGLGLAALLATVCAARARRRAGPIV